MAPITANPILGQVTALPLKLGSLMLVSVNKVINPKKGRKKS